ncbi:hypothetical protein SAMN05444157_3072 [Frankineae bacterium MT45]|nr:hypothetical protein SAMN05444157_3072 [Frankineae bacterium MT45]
MRYRRLTILLSRCELLSVQTYTEWAARLGRPIGGGN